MFNVLVSDLYYVKRKYCGTVQKSMLNFQRGQQLNKNWGFYEMSVCPKTPQASKPQSLFLPNIYQQFILGQYIRIGGGGEETLSSTSLKINLCFGLKPLRLFLICFENGLRNLVRFGIQPILDKCALNTFLCKKHKNTVLTNKFTSVSSVKITEVISTKFVKNMYFG